LPSGARFGDQVADGEDQAVFADHDAAARALGAEDRSGKGVFRNFGAHADHRVERAVKIEAPVLRARPHVDRKGPFALFLRHARILSPMMNHG
jgi:hypothetical protein